MSRSPLGLEVMAILNITPDSFSDGGKIDSGHALLQKAEAAIQTGATVLDIGGESTRPGAEPVSVEEELARVIPAIQQIRQAFPETRISIDTRKAAIAEAALEAGASILNDVSGLQLDGETKLALVKKHHAKLILMHSQGDPKNMQEAPHYKEVVQEVLAFLEKQTQWAISYGIHPEQIIWDPGIGFGKTLEHNLMLMRQLETFTTKGYPVLIGTSRKRFLTLNQSGNQADEIPTSDREALTAVSHTLALQQGVTWFRVHDAKTQVPALKLAQAMLQTQN
jgi:dihydropteroate synthase